MKRLSVAIMMALLLTALPAAAQKVYVDYDTSVDLKSFKSFAWVDTNTTSFKLDYPEVDSLIKNNIEYYMVKGGMVEDSEDPDLFVTYHTGRKSQTQFLTSAFGYEYGAGWTWSPYWGPRVVSGTIATDFKKGMLIIDIWDARKKEAVFRGTATESIGDNPLTTIKKIDKGIEKIVKAWQKMYAEDQAEGR